VEILVGESVFIYVWCGNGVWQQQILDKSTAWHKIRCFFVDVYPCASNNYFSTYCTAFLKLRYRDIVAFRTKN